MKTPFKKASSTNGHGQSKWVKWTEQVGRARGQSKWVEQGDRASGQIVWQWKVLVGRSASPSHQQGGHPVPPTSKEATWPLPLSFFIFSLAKAIIIVICLFPQLEINILAKYLKDSLKTCCKLQAILPPKDAVLEAWRARLLEFQDGIPLLEQLSSKSLKVREDAWSTCMGFKSINIGRTRAQCWGLRMAGLMNYQKCC